MKTKTVNAIDLQKGDTVFVKETGDPVILTSVSTGFYYGSRLLKWGGGDKDWACVLNSTKVEVRE